jgi:hypothetical protein
MQSTVTCHWQREQNTACGCFAQSCRSAPARWILHAVTAYFERILHITMKMDPAAYRLARSHTRISPPAPPDATKWPLQQQNNSTVMQQNIRRCPCAQHKKLAVSASGYVYLHCIHVQQCSLALNLEKPCLQRVYSTQRHACCILLFCNNFNPGVMHPPVAQLQSWYTTRVCCGVCVGDAPQRRAWLGPCPAVAVDEAI